MLARTVFKTLVSPAYFTRTRSNGCPFTCPPVIEVRTLRLKPSRFDLRSSAASLFSGSEALGSRKRNCRVSAPLSWSGIRIHSPVDRQ